MSADSIPLDHMDKAAFCSLTRITMYWRAQVPELLKPQIRTAAGADYTYVVNGDGHKAKTLPVCFADLTTQ